MESLTLMLTLGMIGSGAALAIGTLYVLAVRVRDETALHDLVVRSHHLRLEQARKLAMLGRGSDVMIEEEPIVVGSIAPSPAAKAA